ncbi:carboxylesterase [Bhargavaea ullalensis]|uniref:Carboxylesterase n=1 Tax=Bhargavaea ullalensis TaxID=1265685 RepID=A0ABV2GDL9_9BACL
MKKVKLAPPQPFFFRHGPRAVLLLHGFRGNSADVRMLGRFLEKHDYTCYAPHYSGHGTGPEKLLETGPADWWGDAVEAYKRLKEEGYEEIAVAGLSLGGVFTLKLGYSYPVKGLVSMCAPMSMKTTDIMFEGVLQYAEEYKRYQGKEPETIREEVGSIREAGMDSLPDLREFVLDVREHVDEVYAPILVVQGEKDDVIDPASADYIYGEVQSPKKKLNKYPDSGHVITLGPEKEQLHEDILEFLESLDWND